MRNSPVLLEHVSLMRGLLAASGHPDVARVGSLGEISYLVDELVAPAELEIYDGLCEGLNARNTWRLQQLRQALQPYVGQNLLRAGMRCEFRQYTVYVDPRTESIVHLAGFCLVEPPEAPRDSSPADQARWIFDHPRDGWRDDGRRVVEVLLAGRAVAELSSEELRLLARGYNFWGHHAKSFETARQAGHRPGAAQRRVAHARPAVRLERLRQRRAPAAHRVRRKHHGGNRARRVLASVESGSVHRHGHR
jgi:hypothetical protein